MPVATVHPTQFASEFLDKRGIANFAEMCYNGDNMNMCKRVDLPTSAAVLIQRKEAI